MTTENVRIGKNFLCKTTRKYETGVFMLSHFEKIENAYILIAHDDEEYLKEIQSKIMEREGIVAIYLENSPAVHSFVPGYLSMYSYILPYLSPLCAHAILIKCTNAATVIADLMAEITDVVSKIRKEGIICVIPEFSAKQLTELDSKMIHRSFSFKDLIREEGILLNCEFQDKWQMFEIIAKKALELGWIQDEKHFLQDIVNREKIQSTGIGNGIAFPHTMSETVVKPFLFVLLCKQDFEFEAIDKMPVRLVLVLGIPKNNVSYLSTISKVSKIFTSEENIKSLLQCKDQNDIIQFFQEEI